MHVRIYIHGSSAQGAGCMHSCVGVEADGKKNGKLKLDTQQSGNFRKTGNSTKLEIYQVAVSIKSGNQGFQTSLTTRHLWGCSSSISTKH